MSDRVAQVLLRAKDDGASAAVKGLGQNAGAAGDQVEQLNEQLARTGESGRQAGQGAADGLAPVPRAANDSKEALERLGDGAGRTGANVAKLAGAASALSPALGQSAMAAADLFDVVEVGTAAAGALGVSMGVLVAALVAVAAQVALVYGAYKAWNEEADRAASISAEVAKGQAALVPLLENTRAATIDLKVATGELSELQGELEKNSLRALQAYQQGTEETRKRLSELRREQGSVTTQLVDMAESVIPTWTPLGMAIDGLTTSSKEYGQEISALDGVMGRAIETERTNRLVHEETAKAVDRSTKAKEGAKVAVDALEKALAAENAQMERQRGLASSAATSYLSALSALQAMQDAAEAALATEEERLDLDRQAADEKAQQEAAKALAVATSASAIETTQQQLAATLAAIDAKYYADRDALRQADMAAAIEAYQATEEAASAAAQARTDAASGAINTAAAGPGGLVSTISSLGPVGQIVGAVIGLIDAIGDGLLDQISDWVMGLLDTVGDIGQPIADFIVSILQDWIPSIFENAANLVKSILTDLLPTLIETLLDVDTLNTIVKSLFTAIGDILVTLFKRLPETLINEVKGAFSDGSFWASVGEAIVSAILAPLGLGDKKDRQAAGDWVSQAVSDIGDWLSGNYVAAPAEAYATGSSWVAKTGTATVHEGERIIPATGTGTQRTTQLAGRAGRLELHFHGAVLTQEGAKELVRQLQPYLGDAGVGLQLPAGSVAG